MGNPLSIKSDYVLTTVQQQGSALHIDSLDCSMVCIVGDDPFYDSYRQRMRQRAKAKRMNRQQQRWGA